MTIARLRYDFPCAFSLWGEEEREAIARVTESGKFTMTAGDECRAFEDEFAAWHGRKHGIMVNSGSSANLIATAALFHKNDRPLVAGDRAIVPAIAWATTYAPLVQYGMDLVLVDCGRSWNCQTADLGKEHVGARLMVVCSILGNPGPLRTWEAMAERTGAYIIEDNCESLGAATGPLGGRRLCGTYGTLSTFSFFHSHQLSAIEGGMVLTDDDELADLCRMLRAHGWTRDLKPPEGYERTFADEYDFRLMGYNVRPLEMHAAIARAQLPKQEDFRRQRQQNFNNFIELARGARLRVDIPPMNGFPNPFGLHFRVESRETRARLVVALRENGIDCRLPTGGSFRRHPYAARWSNQVTPNADTVHDTGIFLGNAPFDILGKIEKAVGVMRSVLA